MLLRFYSKLNIMASGCIEWTGGLSGGRYGAITEDSPSRKSIGAHRYSYYIFHGYYPKEVDHTCFNTKCVNPTHLEDVSHDVNMKRADSLYGIRSCKSHCPDGHPYDSINTYISPNSKRRSCKTCYREKYLPKYYAKKIKELNYA